MSRRRLPHRLGSVCMSNNSQTCQDCGRTFYGVYGAPEYLRREMESECVKRVSDEFDVLMNLHRATVDALESVAAENKQLRLDVDRIAAAENEMCEEREAERADALDAAREVARLRRMLANYAPGLVRDEPWFLRYRKPRQPDKWDDAGGHGR